MRRMTQTELAAKSGINQSYLSQLERNAPDAPSPTLRVLFNIAKALDVCPHVLVRYDTNCPLDCVNDCIKP